MGHTTYPVLETHTSALNPDFQRDGYGQRQMLRSRRRLAVRLSSVAASSFTYAAVYLALFYLFRVITSLSAAHFGVEPVLRLDRVEYLRGDLWYPHAVVRTYLAGTLFLGLVVIMASGLLRLLHRSTLTVRMLVVWCVVISTAMVCQRLLGVAVAEPFPFQRLGPMGFELNVYAAFAGFQPSDRGLMVLMGVVFAATVGIVMARPLLATADSSSDIVSGRRRIAFIRDRLWLPAAFGTALAGCVAFPASIVPHLMCLTSAALMALPLTLLAERTNNVRIHRSRHTYGPLIFTLVLFFLISIVIRYALSYGVSF